MSRNEQNLTFLDTKNRILNTDSLKTIKNTKYSNGLYTIEEALNEQGTRLKKIKKYKYVLATDVTDAMILYM